MHKLLIPILCLRQFAAFEAMNNARGVAATGALVVAAINELGPLVDPFAVEREP